MAAVAALPGGARACPRVNTGRVPETGAVFDGAEFSGGEVNFSGAMDWSHPPIFGWDGKPPTGVVLQVQPSEEQRREH